MLSLPPWTVEWYVSFACYGRFVFDETGSIDLWENWGRALLDCAFVVTQRLTAASISASDVCLKGYSSQEFKSPLPLHLFLGVWQASL